MGGEIDRKTREMKVKSNIKNQCRFMGAKPRKLNLYIIYICMCVCERERVYMRFMYHVTYYKKCKT